ncbi:MAG: HAD family hydrolase [Flavonifractor plautii]
MHVSVTRLFPGALELLTALKRRGTPTGIVSTKKTATIRDVAEARGITPLLSSILGGDQVSAPKPDPEGLLASLTALGLEPHEVLFCGDTVIDGEAARRAGTHFCAVLNGTTTFEEFQTRRIPCDHVAGDPGIPKLSGWASTESNVPAAKRPPDGRPLFWYPFL